MAAEFNEYELVQAARYSVQKVDRYLEAIAGRAILAFKGSSPDALAAADRAINAARLDLEGATDRLHGALPARYQSPQRNQTSTSQVSA